MMKERKKKSKEGARKNEFELWRKDREIEKEK
jgi:hypothetical protein